MAPGERPLEPPRDAPREEQAPERAEYIRVITTELNRITSHQLWFGALLLDLGGTYIPVRMLLVEFIKEETIQAVEVASPPSPRYQSGGVS